MKVGPLILACFTVYRVAPQTESGTAFKVHVINSVTGTPIAAANVVLSHEQDHQLWGRTDARGAFKARTHSAGSYLLTVTRRGYRMTGGGLGKMVDVEPGVETEATVRMQPFGVLAGRVLDQYGDPVRHAIVRTEDKMSVPGQDPYYETSSAADTDDRGEYRVMEVEPGQHYLAVEYNSADEERRSGTRSRYRWPQTGGLLLYPDAADIEHAQPVEAAAGATTRLADVRLKVQRAVTISGRIKPPPADNIQSLSLERTDKLALHSSPMVQGGGSEADGSFKIDALPGKYVLTASDGKAGKVSRPLTLEVREKDITGLELELTSGYEINGRVAVDGQERVDFSTLLLNFGGSQIKVEGDGIFHANLLGGNCVYMLQGLPEDWYIKSVLVAGRRIKGRQFEIEPGTTDVILTLSPRGARVSISLEGAVSGLAAAYVALLPETGDVPDVESVLQAQADASGAFNVLSVPPGSYRVFTLNASNWVLLMTPDVLLEKYRQLAPLISVTEGEQKELVIPALNIKLE